MTSGLKNFWSTLKLTYTKWNERDPFRQSAVIAYYAVFSMPGLLVVLITIAGIFFDKGAVSGHLQREIASSMGKETADQILETLNNASRGGKTVWATIIGVITILLGATGVFEQLQKSFNLIWEVKLKEEKGIWKFVKARVFSFGLIISIGFLILVSLLLTTIIGALGTFLKARFPDWIEVVFQILNFILSFGIITVLFALMFKILPDAKIKWKHVRTGALLTTLLFMLGKTALGIYFGKANPGSSYGAAGSIILVLLWVSYSSMIVFFGAEYTRISAVQTDKKIVPEDHAEKITVHKDTIHA